MTSAAKLKSQLQSVRKSPPNAGGLPVIGVMHRMAGKPLKLLLEVAEAHPDIAYLGRVNGETYYLVTNPVYCKYVFQDNNKNYLNRISGDHLKPLAGNGLATSEGEFWRSQRRLMQPAFHRRTLKTMFSTMTEEIEALIECWKPLADTGKTVDISGEMVRLTIRIIMKTMCSTELNEPAEKIESALNFTLDFLYRRRYNPLSLPLNWPTSRNKRYHRDLQTVHDIIDRLIDKRYHNHLNTGDLLSMLIEARDPKTGKGMSRQQLHDEILTILMAGYDTTATTLSWLWYLLSKHPETAKKVYEESDQVLNSQHPEIEDVARLSFIGQVFKETLRIYPPVWLTARIAYNDDVIDGYHIPKGACLLICPYVVHRQLEFWDRPENFEPERFNKQLPDNRPQFAYQPFGGGPRLCIGKHMAELESNLAVAMISQNYTLKLVPDHPVIPKTDLTLRAAQGIKMTIHRRQR